MSRLWTTTDGQRTECEDRARILETEFAKIGTKRCFSAEKILISVCNMCWYLFIYISDTHEHFFVLVLAHVVPMFNFNQRCICVFVFGSQVSGGG